MTEKTAGDLEVRVAQMEQGLQELRSEVGALVERLSGVGALLVTSGPPIDPHSGDTA